MPDSLEVTRSLSTWSFSRCCLVLIFSETSESCQWVKIMLTACNIGKLFLRLNASATLTFWLFDEVHHGWFVIAFNAHIIVWRWVLLLWLQTSISCCYIFLGWEQLGRCLDSYNYVCSVTYVVICYREISLNTAMLPVCETWLLCLWGENINTDISFVTYSYFHW